MGITIDTLMLDTTYSTPKWTFPNQETAVQMAVDIIHKAREDHAGQFAATVMHVSCSAVSCLYVTIS